MGGCQSSVAGRWTVRGGVRNRGRALTRCSGGGKHGRVWSPRRRLCRPLCRWSCGRTGCRAGSSCRCRTGPSAQPTWHAAAGRQQACGTVPVHMVVVARGSSGARAPRQRSHAAKLSDRVSDDAGWQVPPQFARTRAAISAGCRKPLTPCSRYASSPGTVFEGTVCVRSCGNGVLRAVEKCAVLADDATHDNGVYHHAITCAECMHV